MPLVPAGLKVWQLAQALARKTDFPFAELLDAGVVFVVVATLVVATLVDVAGAATVMVRVTVRPLELECPIAQPTTPAGTSNAKNRSQTKTSPNVTAGSRFRSAATSRTLPAGTGARRHRNYSLSGGDDPARNLETLSAARALESCRTRSSSVGMCVGERFELALEPLLAQGVVELRGLELGALRLPLSEKCGVKGRVGFAAGEASERSEQSEWLPDRLVAGETSERAPRRLAPGRVRSRPVHHVLDIEAFFGRGTGPSVRVITTFVPRTRRFHRPIMVSHGDARV